MITPNQHEKNEWSRMASDAYRMGRNFYGHRYSAWASIPANTQVSEAIYDTLQHNYCLWLNEGWSAFHE